MTVFFKTFKMYPGRGSRLSEWQKKTCFLMIGIKNGDCNLFGLLLRFYAGQIAGKTFFLFHVALAGNHDSLSLW